MIKYCRCKYCKAIRNKHKADGTYKKWLKEGKIINKLKLDQHWQWVDSK